MSNNNDMDQITEKIWLGGWLSGKKVDILKKEGIKKIICVMDNLPPQYSNEENFNRKVIKVADLPSENIIKYFGECLNFMEGSEKILVHCMAGASRSASIVIAYIMWKYKRSADDALKFVQQKRSCVFPNLGFMNQLKKFESLLKENDYDLSKINFKIIKWKYTW